MRMHFDGPGSFPGLTIFSAKPAKKGVQERNPLNHSANLKLASYNPNLRQKVNIGWLTRKMQQIPRGF